VLILIIILVLVLGGGGGYYGHSRWGYGGGAGIGLGTILLILLVAGDLPLRRSPPPDVRQAPVLICGPTKTELPSRNGQRDRPCVCKKVDFRFFRNDVLVVENDVEE